MNKKIVLLLFAAISMFGCKSEDPTVVKLQIVSPSEITSQVLNPETSYTFGINECPYDSIVFSAGLVKKDGTLFDIAVSKSQSLIVKYKSDTIPEGEWTRGKDDNTYVKGIISCCRFYKNIKDTACYKFYIPFKPDKPQIALLDTTMHAKNITAFIGFNAEGSLKYKINYAVYGETSDNVISLNSKEQSVCVFSNLNPGKRYSVSVQAINNFGSVMSDTLIIGSTYTTASCVFTKTGTDAKYQIKVGETIMDDLVITSAAIYDSSDVLRMNVTTTPNQTFSIASLTSGVYVLKVMVKDYGQCSKSFLK
ncbi:hypothetical protein TRIP_D300159 [uncultured Paludibacter sp.]|nr:hypothetical protein TRIP_D300159 [uncultured Paludibacter sp.]